MLRWLGLIVRGTQDGNILGMFFFFFYHKPNPYMQMTPIRARTGHVSHLMTHRLDVSLQTSARLTQTSPFYQIRFSFFGGGNFTKPQLKLQTRLSGTRTALFYIKHIHYLGHSYSRCGFLVAIRLQTWHFLLVKSAQPVQDDKVSVNTWLPMIREEAEG